VRRVTGAQLVTRNNPRVKRVKLDETNILGILRIRKRLAIVMVGVKGGNSACPQLHRTMGLVDEKTVKQIFGDLFDAPTSDEVVKECKVVTLD
jgi:hypothetical protein